MNTTSSLDQNLIQTNEPSSPFKSTKQRTKSINKDSVDLSDSDFDYNNRSISEVHELEKPRNTIKEPSNSKSTNNNFIYNRPASKSVVSFKNGIPQNLDDIERLESPLYRVSTRNIVKSKLEQKEDETIHHTIETSFNSNIHTILQIVNCIIRYTVVQFPFCFKVLGLIYGSGIITFIAAMCMYSMYLIVQIYNAKKLNSFSLYAYEWWGMKGKIMILFLNLLGAFGSCLSYVIITLKIIPNLFIKFFGENTLFANHLFWSILAGLILAIYSLKKDISGTKSAAVVGIFAIFAFLCMIVFDLLYSSWSEQMNYEFKLNFVNIHVDYDFFSCIACIILSFSFHPYTFSIYECLETKTTRNMIITSSIGIFISLFIYLLIGSIGYIMYGRVLSESFLDSMETENGSPLLILENIAFVLNVIMSFPITYAVLKNYIFFAVSLLLTHIRDMGKKVKKIIKKSKNKENFSKNNNIPKETHEEDYNDKNDNFNNEVINRKVQPNANILENKKNIKVMINEKDRSIIKEVESQKVENQEDVTSEIENQSPTHIEKNYEDNQVHENSDHFYNPTENHIHDGEHDHHDMVILSPLAQSFLSVAVISLIIFIANEYSSIKVIFSFLGATYANINAFILPSMFYLKFASDGKFWKNLLPYIFILIGMIGLVTCVTSNILSIIHGTPH